MRDYYEGTPYDLTQGMAAGPFGTPMRWRAGAASSPAGNFERPIATAKTIVSYVLEVRSWLPPEVGAVLWFAMHAAHTSVTEAPGAERRVLEFSL